MKVENGAGDVVTPEQIGAGGSRNRVRQQDWDQDTRPLINLAVAYFKLKVLTGNPCPSMAEARDFATDGWFLACKEENVKVELTPPVITTVRLL